MREQERAALTACVEALRATRDDLRETFDHRVNHDHYRQSVLDQTIIVLDRADAALAQAEAALAGADDHADVPSIILAQVREALRAKDGEDVVMLAHQTFALSILNEQRNDLRQTQAADVAALREHVARLRAEIAERDRAVVESERDRASAFYERNEARECEELATAAVARLTAERDAALAERDAMRAALDRVLQRIVRHVDYDDPEECAWYELPDDGTVDVVRAAWRRA